MKALYKATKEKVRAQQIAHLNEPANLKLFRADKGRSVGEYFSDYADEYEQDNDGDPDALYICVCADLGIAPKYTMPA